MQTNVKVRAQANGGKYIGKALDAAPPTLYVQGIIGPLLGPFAFPTGSSGSIYPPPPPPPGISPYPIVVQSAPFSSPYTPGTYYLGAPSDPLPLDSYLIVTLDLPAGPSAVSFFVQAFAPQPVVASRTVMLMGGVDQTAEPGVVVQIPGLRLTQVTATTDSATTKISAYVTMMCGCQVSPNNADPLPQEPYWPAYEFEVRTSLAGIMDLPLTCTGPGTFSAILDAGFAIGTPVAVTAKQPATGNANYALTAVVPGSVSP